MRFPVLTSEERMRVVREARSWLGVPYRRRGADRSGVDCSLFVMRVFMDTLNLPLPGDCDGLFLKMPVQHPAEVQRGDLLFFRRRTDDVRLATHVAIVTGDRWCIHASESRGGVFEEALAAVLWRENGLEIVRGKDPKQLERWCRLYWERTQTA